MEYILSGRFYLRVQKPKEDSESAAGEPGVHRHEEVMFQGGVPLAVNLHRRGDLSVCLCREELGPVGWELH